MGPSGANTGEPHVGEGLGGGQAALAAETSAPKGPRSKSQQAPLTLSSLCHCVAWEDPPTSSSPGRRWVVWRETPCPDPKPLSDGDPPSPKLLPCGEVAPYDPGWL
ncbi:myogenic factor 5 [Platysternon megacephalum]|uniref:Myogenic factor 5 n=1 Tax=Platysternon megacephalum TaxID=55544 RepID=A0A4D9DGZ3_9SAUR|nr:myogenic factor 5 [Platysternon megacephalum]